jgi:hypothetical protein
MTHTVKMARHRAAQDPDRGDATNDYRGKGVYFGSNITPRAMLADPSGTVPRGRTTHGACT